LEGPEEPPLSQIAAQLSSALRYDTPNAPAELEALFGLAAEPPVVPERLGQVAGVFVDVMIGRRSIESARAVARATATAHSLPLAYGERLSEVTAFLLARGRSREGVALSWLLMEAADVVYGRTSRLWVNAALHFVQAVEPARASSRLGTLSLPERSDTLLIVTDMIAGAGATADGSLVASCLSAAAQHWWVLSRESEEDQVPALLEQASAALEEAAQGREGAERGRTLSTLAQIRADLLRRGLTTPEQVADAALEAALLTDREDRPRQWLAARVIAAEHAGELPDEPIAASDIEAIRERHGRDVACECLRLAVRLLVVTGEHSAAKVLLRQSWNVVGVLLVESERQRQQLLEIAIHSLDGGLVPCSDLAAADAAELFRRLERLPAPRQHVARLHLALHGAEGGPALEWALQHAPSLMAGITDPSTAEPMLYALGLIHAARVADETTPLWYRFRCALLTAVMFGPLGLRGLIIEALRVALGLLDEWAGVTCRLQQAGDADAAATNWRRSLTHVCVKP